MEIKSNIVQLQRFQRSKTFLRSLKYIFCISKVKYQHVIKPFNFLPRLKVNWREISNWQENKWNILKEPIWWCRGRQMCQFYICLSKVLVVVFPVSSVNSQAATTPVQWSCTSRTNPGTPHHFCSQDTFYSSATPAWMFPVPVKGLMTINQ